MRKTILGLWLLSSTILSAQWDSTGLTAGINNQQIEAIDAFTHFQGRLYAHTFLGGMKSSDDYGQTWDSLAKGIFNGVPIEYYSLDQKLYTMTIVSGAVGGIQYYTTDQGASWIVDTVGMPRSPINPAFRAVVIEAQQLGDYLFYHFNLPLEQFYWRHKDSTVYHPDAHANSNFMHGWCIENDTLWASVGQTVEYLTQARGAYTANANTGLNNAFGSVIEKSNGSIYLASTDANLDWFIARSQNSGQTWDTLHMQNILGTGAFGLKRGISSIYAQGNEVWLGPNSKGSNTQCEILYSSDRGNTWTVQSANLPTDPFGTYAVSKFVMAGGYIFAHMGFRDIYRQARNVSLEEKSINEIHLFPNPARAEFRIKSSIPVQRLIVRDLRGNTIQEYHAMQSYDVSALRSGVYILSIHLEGGAIENRNLLVP